LVFVLWNYFVICALLFDIGKRALSFVIILSFVIQTRVTFINESIAPLRIFNAILNI